MEPTEPPERIDVGPDGIRLGQLLKLADLADTGGAAKTLLEDGAVDVNGEVEARRGRQLRTGDVVTCAGRSIEIA